MIVYFLIMSLAAFTVGPLHMEGGADAIKEKGVREAVSVAWAERDPVDYGRLNN